MTKTNADCDNRPEEADERLDLGTNAERANLDATIDRGFESLNATMERGFENLDATMKSGFESLDSKSGSRSADAEVNRQKAIDKRHIEIAKRNAVLDYKMDECFKRINALFEKIHADNRQMRWMLIAINLGLAYLIIKDLLSE